MAETSGLLNRRTGDSRTEGSNPSVSASNRYLTGHVGLIRELHETAAQLHSALRRLPGSLKGHGDFTVEYPGLLGLLSEVLQESPEILLDAPGQVREGW